jgi:hypothetical protein
METGAQRERGELPAARSERLAIHNQNCQALAQAYAQSRGKSPRVLRYEIDALLQVVSTERELWEPDFNATQFLDRMTPVLRRHHQLSLKHMV